MNPKTIGLTLLFLAGAYLLNRLNTQLPGIVLIDLFFVITARIFLQQKLKVYKVLGWVLIFCAAWWTLVQAFPDIVLILN